MDYRRELPMGESIYEVHNVQGVYKALLLCPPRIPKLRALFDEEGVRGVM